jgi:arginyl-tRNA synthetase
MLLRVACCYCVVKHTHKQVYDRLNVELTECGESFYNKMIPATLDEMDKAGILKVY